MADGGENHEAHEHPCRAEDERLATTEMLDDVKTEEGGSEVDASQDHLGNETVVYARRLEDDSPVVEEVVCTSELLQCLKSHTKSDSVRHPWSSKHIEVFRRSSVQHFLVVFCLDLG